MAQQLSELKKVDPKTFGTPESSKGKKSLRLIKNESFWPKLVFYLVIAFFIINLVALVGTVIVDSFAIQWFKSWLPDGYSWKWYDTIKSDHDLGHLLFNTFFVAIVTTLVALILGFPAAYVLARNEFRFKTALTVLYLVPMLVPPLVYGIPLATIFLKLNVEGLPAVILANLVPILPFVILILAPFIEQIDPSLESASRMLGAPRWQTFRRVVLPLMIPGLLTASLLSVVRAISMFELTFLVSNPNSTTLVVALYNDAFAAGIRADQAIDAMAVLYMLTTMGPLVVALMFVKPTQFVVRIKTK